MEQIHRNHRTLVWHILAAVLAPFLVTLVYLLFTRWHTWHFTMPAADYAALAFSILVGAAFIATLPIRIPRRIVSLLIYVPVSGIALYIFGVVFLYLWYGWVPVPRTPGPHDYTEQDIESFITPA